MPGSAGKVELNLPSFHSRGAFALPQEVRNLKMTDFNIIWRLWQKTRTINHYSWAHFPLSLACNSPLTSISVANLACLEPFSSWTNLSLILQICTWCQLCAKYCSKPWAVAANKQIKIIFLAKGYIQVRWQPTYKLIFKINKRCM